MQLRLSSGFRCRQPSPDGSFFRLLAGSSLNHCMYGQGNPDSGGHPEQKTQNKIPRPPDARPAQNWSYDNAECPDGGQRTAQAKFCICVQLSTFLFTRNHRPEHCIGEKGIVFRQIQNKIRGLGIAQALIIRPHLRCCLRLPGPPQHFKQ